MTGTGGIVGIELKICVGGGLALGLMVIVVAATEEAREKSAGALVCGLLRQIEIWLGEASGNCGRRGGGIWVGCKADVCAFLAGLIGGGRGRFFGGGGSDGVFSKGAVR